MELTCEHLRAAGIISGDCCHECVEQEGGPNEIYLAGDDNQFVVCCDHQHVLGDMSHRERIELFQRLAGTRPVEWELIEGGAG